MEIEKEKMKEERVIFAGFGGQGVLSLGQILSYAALKAGKNLTHIASYGPEMRGGTCNCHVIISDEKISSPLISKGKADTILAFNPPSVEKFLGWLKSDGLIIINSSLVQKEYDFGSRTAIKVPFNDLAMQNFQNPKPFNMIALGVYLNLKMRGIIDLETVKEVVYPMFANKLKGDKEKNEAIAKINCQALEFGYNLEIKQ